MTIEDYTKQSNASANNRAMASGKFTNRFNSKAYADRQKTAERKRRLRTLVHSNITDISTLAQYFGISPATIRKLAYSVGYRISNGYIVEG
ncbi:hypothetical protein C0V80_04720 [Leuconostoc pseudomesenteroides]|uniref:hypothetical protein n=1 Tax=Leuconostoc pseudomesenteroides TaxID=33968 RepID=UPI001E530AF1|nr:hypothetical protein [Leuconostoc pseudomesenteroides]MCC7668896.1 hypothetical protein [Leuconostoc pseudomesenteroides]